jgi:uncharacterized cupredoxin-like copper-binding protein
MKAGRLCIVLALLLASAASALAEAKAYELFKYRGKAEGLTIAFDLAAGYPEASEVRIKQGRRGKTTRFVLKEGDDADAEMRFVPEKNRASGEEVTIELSPDDGSDDKVNGTYRAGGKTIRFTLLLLED